MTTPPRLKPHNLSPNHNARDQRLSFLHTSSQRLSRLITRQSFLSISGSDSYSSRTEKRRHVLGPSRSFGDRHAHRSRPQTSTELDGCCPIQWRCHSRTPDSSTSINVNADGEPLLPFESIHRLSNRASSASLRRHSRESASTTGTDVLFEPVSDGAAIIDSSVETSTSRTPMGLEDAATVVQSMIKSNSGKEYPGLDAMKVKSRTDEYRRSVALEAGTQSSRRRHPWPAPRRQLKSNNTCDGDQSRSPLGQSSQELQEAMSFSKVEVATVPSQPTIDAKSSPRCQVSPAATHGRRTTQAPKPPPRMSSKGFRKPGQTQNAPQFRSVGSALSPFSQIQEAADRSRHGG